MDLFGTAGIRGSAEKRVTPELALAVGRAVAAEIRERGAEEPTTEAGDASPAAEVVLARDGRVTGPAIAAAMESGLARAACGCSGPASSRRRGSHTPRGAGTA